VKTVSAISRLLPVNVHRVQDSPFPTGRDNVGLLPRPFGFATIERALLVAPVEPSDLVAL
jgi:hypothetical protein